MRPPKSGPATVDRAETAKVIAIYMGSLALGTNWNSTAMATEKAPEAPIPWKTRNMILELGLR